MCHGSIVSLEAKVPIGSFQLRQADSGLHSPLPRVHAQDKAEFPVRTLLCENIYNLLDGNDNNDINFRDLSKYLNLFYVWSISS